METNILIFILEGLGALCFVSVPNDYVYVSVNSRARAKVKDDGHEGDH